ncbi:MAG: tetratricopeptide repeat protein, partial [Moorea sp. SIO3G5]|nr:tetratricopeptide repeat protein [Moorena sp. SIO3G5]
TKFFRSLKYASWENKAKADFLVRQGRAFISQKEPNIKSAIKKFKKAQKLNPDIDLNPSTKEIDKDPKTVAHLLAAPAKVQFGAILAREGKIKEAISAYQEAQKLNQEAQTLYPDIDLNPLTKEIDKDPKKVAQQLATEGKVEQGMLLAIQQRIEQAISAYQEAQKLNPDIDLNPKTKEIDKDPKTVARQLAAQAAAEAKLYLGMILVIEGEIKEAISVYQEAQKLNPDIDLNPLTKEIDKDPKKVVEQLALDSE